MGLGITSLWVFIVYHYLLHHAVRLQKEPNQWIRNARIIFK